MIDRGTLSVDVPAGSMSAPIRQVYAVQEAVADPSAVPLPPAPAFRFVELQGRASTFAVYFGAPPRTRHIGYCRHDPDNGLWIARTTGCPQGKAAADIRRWPSRDKAAAWLSGAVNGVRPRIMTRRAAR